MIVSANLHQGDIIIEPVVNMGPSVLSREVIIDKVESGETWFNGELRDVLYVYGTDIRNQNKVRWAKTPYDQWPEVLRAADILDGKTA